MVVGDENFHTRIVDTEPVDDEAAEL
jgi:hypothetical protein